MIIMLDLIGRFHPLFTCVSSDPCLLNEVCQNATCNALFSSSAQCSCEAVASPVFISVGVVLGTPAAWPAVFGEIVYKIKTSPCPSPFCGSNLKLRFSLP